MAIKQSLTSLQIAQFLVGFVWGYCYLFVKYTVPFDFTLQAQDLHSAIESNMVSIDAPTSCLSDSGEAFTVILTTAYVLPLLLLFVRFFLASYTKVKKA